ncbi:MAG: hypothetical protein M1812_004967 [Candelaria pacifica]|nr:MAG: hypothetical protein M1812_004967 [Candelaria pacifica]
MKRFSHLVGTWLVRQKQGGRAFELNLQSIRQISNPSLQPERISSILSKPTWSVRSLLPSTPESTTIPEVSSKQLHHLLRLSALPPPKDNTEEERMLKTLSSQLSFVKEIQNVDTTDVMPLQSIRDETAEAESENEITMDKLKGAFAEEEVGANPRKRTRKSLVIDTEGAEDWDPLAHTSKKVGRFFVVESGKT